MQVKWNSLGVAVLLAAGVLLTPPVAKAQQSRARTLNYDAERREWVEAPVPLAGTPEGDLYQVERLIQEGENRRALSACKEFVETHGTANPAYPGVLIAQAKALVGQRQYYKAYEKLEQFLADFGGASLTAEALRLEFVIAEAYLAGAKRSVWGIRLLSGEEIAYRILDDISLNYPDERYAELAVKTKADHLFKEGEYDLAELEYARLLHDFPTSRYCQYALRRSAEATLASFAGIDFDDAALIEAEERYREYQAGYRAAAEAEGVSLILGEIRERQASKKFSVGHHYERTGHLSSAVFYYRSTVEDWPDTVAATKAKTRLGLLGVEPAALRSTYPG